MHLNGWFGHLDAWLLLVVLVVAVIDRVEAWRERRGGR